MAIQDINQQEVAQVSGGVLDLALGGLVPSLTNSLQQIPLLGGLLGGLLNGVNDLVTGLVSGLTGSAAPLGNQVNDIVNGLPLVGGLLGGLLGSLGLTAKR